MEQADIGKHHLFAQGGYIMFRNPIKFLPGFGGIADEQVYFCRSVIIFVDAHQDITCCEMARLPGNMDIKIFINEPNGSGFIGTVAIENNLYAYFTKGHADKITNLVSPLSGLVVTKKYHGPVAGLTAASIDTCPGFEMGPGGRPLWTWVL